MGRVPVEPEVRGPDGQALGHPQPGAKHDAHGYASLVARRGRHQRRRLFAGEVVVAFPEFSCHDNVRFREFPQLALENSVGRGKLVRR